MQTLQLVRVLTAVAGLQVAVVCYFEFEPEVVGEFESAGAKVHLLDLSRSLSAAQVVRRLIAEFRSLKPDLGTCAIHGTGFVTDYRRPPGRLQQSGRHGTSALDHR